MEAMKQEPVIDHGIADIWRSTAVPGLVFATVRGRVWEGARGIGEHLRSILALKEPFVAAKLTEERLYAGFLEPHRKTGAVHEAIVAAPERSTEDEWRYVSLPWAMLCYRPDYHKVYVMLHADISFGLRDGIVVWKALEFPDMVEPHLLRNGKAAPGFYPYPIIEVLAHGASVTDRFMIGIPNGDRRKFLEYRLVLEKGELKTEPYVKRP